MTSSSSSGQRPAGKRARGRPPRTPLETQAIRDRIKLATAQVFAEHGYHAVSVELILQAGQLSRATFYRYFSSANEVIELILQEANDRLRNDIVSAIRGAEGPFQKVEAGLLAWRSWGEQMGPLLKVIFAEVRDSRSSAAQHRQRVLATVASELNAAAAALQRAPFDPLQIETFVMGVEYLGYRYHFGVEGPTPAAWEWTRQAMLRLALGVLGGDMEWRHAVQLASVLGVTLS